MGLHGEPEPYTASILSAQLGGAAENLLDAIGLIPWTRTNPSAQIARQFIRSQAGEESWNEAWAKGRSLTAEQAVDLACKMA